MQNTNEYNKPYKMELLQAAVDLQPLSDRQCALVTDFIATLQLISQN